MTSANYSNCDIDTSDIWEYEFSEFNRTGSSTIYKDLLQVIEPIISAHTTPFFSQKSQSADQRDWTSKYTEDYEIKYNAYSTDYFRVYLDYYAYGEPYKVAFSKSMQKEFTLLFAFKLRQYKDNLSGLDAFLNHQIQENFNKNVTAFTNFLESILMQFSEILGETIERKVSLWEKRYSPDNLNVSKDAWLHEDADLWEKIDVSLTDDQIREFFSFLYLEKNNLGIPLLEKKSVDKLLQFGFKFPIIPLKEKFKLNLTPQWRKSIIESCTYLLFERFARNFKNKQPFLKFLAYQFDDFSKIQSESDYKNWNKNFTQKKLSKPLPFDIRIYLERAKKVV